MSKTSKIISTEIGTYVDLDNPFEVIQNRLNEIEEEYTDHFDFRLAVEAYKEFGDNCVRVKVHASRYETQYEAGMRIRNIEAKKQRAIESRKALLKELKEEFGE